MNEKDENVGEEKMLGQTHAAQVSVRLPSRRRLIKLGAAGVPVVATLTSSPALAWNCKNPSAWGSNVVASQKTNASNVPREYESWYIANWKSNSRTGTKLGKPWDVLKTTYTSLSSSAYTDITLGQLKGVNAIVAYPRGGTADTKAVTILNGGDTFAIAILVAMLNSTVGPYRTVVLGCVSDSLKNNQLIAMSQLQYAPPGGGAKWDESKTITYLSENWLAR